MRQTLRATAICCGFALSAPAYAQTGATAPDAPPAAMPAPAAEPPAPPPPPSSAPDAPPPPSDSAPMPPKKPMMKHAMGSAASNLGPADTKSDIAPRLPTPMAGPDAGPGRYLMAARHALKAHRTGEAQEALEMAETRALDRSAPVDEAGTPSKDPTVTAIHAALDSLGRKDIEATNASIDKAMMGMKAEHDEPGEGMHHPGHDHPHPHPMHKMTPPPAPPAQ